MIDPKDLRIGNYIMDEDGQLCIINGFMPLDHSFRCDEEEGCQICIDVIKADGGINKGWITDSTLSNPIPLTPEWLGKIEMAKRFPNDNCNIWDMKEPSTRNKAFSLALLKEGWIYPTAPGAIPFHYLHQLQNIYYFLTGKELNLKNNN